jgi:hypothetical protein
VRSWKLESEQQTPTTLTATLPYPGIKRRLTKLPPSTPLRRSNSEPLLAKAQRPLSRSRTLLWKNSAKSSSRVNLDGFAEPVKLASFGRSKSLLRKASAKSASAKSTSRLRLADLANPDGHCAAADVDTYWPLEFLPASCPNARVFTWGYQVLVPNKKPLRAQGDVFTHAEELLVELASTRAALGAGARPIVFVAHSTGGVLVKEVTTTPYPNPPVFAHPTHAPQLLRLSEAERDGPLKRILLSTSAVVFLGSPHRGTEHCSLGDAVRSMASATTLPIIDPTDPVLSELCGANDARRVELGRQEFVRLWNDYNFRVKTFQESVIPSYEYPELRAETVSGL